MQRLRELNHEQSFGTVSVDRGVRRGGLNRRFGESAVARAPSERAFIAATRCRSLIDLDEEFAAAIPAGDRSRAQRVRVPVWSIAAGCLARETFTLTDTTFALLIIDGMLTREAQISAQTISELLLPGDVVAPWAPSPTTPTSESRLTALEDITVAVLDQIFIKSAAVWPALMVGLHRRLNDHQHRLAVHGAICQLPRVEQRVLAIMWHLASRTGRITAKGTIVPHGLTHQAIADLIGAQRPTVSLAVKRLEAEAHLCRRADGTWLLPRFSGETSFDGLTASPAEL
jgi:CRP-like cAMP-binding protein